MAPLRLPFSARHLVQTRPRARILLAHNTRTITTSPLCRDKTENDSDKKANLLDKDAMNTSSNEYSKSAGDAEVAHTDAAFDPGNTSPEGQAGGVEVCFLSTFLLHNPCLSSLSYIRSHRSCVTISTPLPTRSHSLRLPFSTTPHDQVPD